MYPAFCKGHCYDHAMTYFLSPSHFLKRAIFQNSQLLPLIQVIKKLPKDVVTIDIKSGV